MGELLKSLAIHALFFAVYLAIAFRLAWLAGNSFTLGRDDGAWGAEVFAFGWLVFISGPIWLMIAALLGWWWWNERHGLVERTIWWDLLLWLGVLLLLPLAWKNTRTYFVPPRNPA